MLNIPLNNYLLAFRSEFYKDMDKQEFLDRQSEWSMLFLLDTDYRWLKTTIKINDWTVRVNDIQK